MVYTMHRKANEVFTKGVHVPVHENVEKLM